MFADEGPVFAGVLGLLLIRILTHEHVEINCGAILVTEFLEFGELGVDEQDLGLAGIGILLLLAAELLDDRSRGELGYVVKIAAIPRGLHTSVRHFGTLEEPVHIESGRNIGVITGEGAGGAAALFSQCVPA